MAMRKYRKKNTSGTHINDLPHSIVSDILSRVPINTVAQSLLVCRTWCAVVLEPHFAKMHLARSSKTMKGGRLYCQKSIMGRFSIENFQRQGRFGIENFPLAGLEILCSCNGMLLCLSRADDTVYICNPVRRLEWISLPRPNIKPSQNHPQYADYGFGFCHQSNLYKVIRIVTTGISDSSGGGCVIQCEIHTLGTNAWRCIGDVPFKEEYLRHLALGGTLSRCIHFNGDLHLLVKTKGGQPHDPLFISCFKIREEKFELLGQVPVVDSPRSIFTLGVLQNRLVLVDACYYDSRIDIWEMRDYGVAASWSRRFVLGRSILKGVKNASWLKPIKITEDGELLMSCLFQDFAHDFGMISYNPETKTIRKHILQGIEYRQRIDIVPSFLSPRGIVRGVQH